MPGSGEFALGEQSERSRELDSRWDSTWRGDVPVGHLLRSNYESRWVRLHSLPDGKRYADTEDEHAEILHRHRVVLADLLSNSTIDDLTVLAEDWDRRDLATGWVKRVLPDVWPWRRFAGDQGATSYVWVRSHLSEAQLDALLRAIADDAGSAILTDSTMSWLYCPYDGGADVILPSAGERDRLASRYAVWLPRE